KSQFVPDLATSGLSTVAIRMPRHPIAQMLLSKARFPLAAPSANRFGRISPTSPEDVQAELGDRIELILDGGLCEIGLESTVLSVSADSQMILLGPGGVPISEIEALAGTKVRELGRTDASQAGGAVAPGMLASHY